MAGRSILVQILGDSTKFEKALANATGSTTKFGNILTGIGQGIGQKAFGLLDNAISGVAGALGDMVRKAGQEETNIARLGASLKANIAGWDGNTAAIEAQIKEREKLAFSDDELRSSLALLVGATHDVTKAQDIQATAMDLARFKGIDLATASEALTKVEAGSYRILKSLGIELKAGATQTEALAAVQAVASGSAKAYGDTFAGVSTSVGIAINDIEEDIGKQLLPTIKKFLVFVRDDLLPFIQDNLVPALENLGKVIHTAQTVIDPYGTAVGDAKDQLLDFYAAAKDADTASERFGSSLSRSLAETTVAAATAVPSFVRSLKTIGTAASATADVVGRMPDKIAGSFMAGNDAVLAAAQGLADQIATPFLGAKQLRLILEGEGSVGKRLVKGLNSSRPDVREAAEKMRDAILAELAKFSVKVGIEVSGNAKLPHKAAGGPVSAYGAYTVGEKGPETLVMGSQGGTIIPHGMGGGGVVNNIYIGNGAYIDGPSIDRLVTALTQRMRYAPGV